MDLPVDPSRYLVYLGVMASMAAFPGPSNLMCMALGMQRGPAAAYAACAGMNAATLVWYCAAALGLGALMAASPELLRWAALIGAAYLLWMALKAARAAWRNADELRQPPPRPGRSALRDGFLVQIANPKIVLFFGAVLPSFVDLRRPLAPQLVLFAIATVGLDAIAMSSYGAGGAALARRMAQPVFRRGFNIASALFLTAAAALVARG